MANVAEKWREVKQKILDNLDIQAEYATMGVLFPSGARARASGWMPCHAVGRQDRNPSAEINVGAGPLRGRYRDFGGNKYRASIFDFAVDFGPAVDFKHALRHFAKVSGVTLPQSWEQRAIDKLDVSGWNQTLMQNWCQLKSGIDPFALKKCRAVIARYPRNLQPELQQYVIAFPIHGAGLFDSDPVGYHFTEHRGRKIRLYQGKDVQPRWEDKLTVGEGGMIGMLDDLPDATDVVKCEGLTDLATVITTIEREKMFLPKALAGIDCYSERKFAAISHSSGSMAGADADFLQHLADKRVHIIGDADIPGQDGAERWCGQCVPVAKEVRNVRLPYPIEEKHGKDLRDWLGEGHGLKDLVDLIDKAPVITPEQAETLVEGHELILRRLGIRVIGEHQHNKSIDCYSEELRKTVTIKDLNRLSFVDLLQHFGGKTVNEVVFDGPDPPDGMYTVKEVRKAIATEAGKDTLDDESYLGLGIWRIDNNVYFVNARDGSVWNGSGNLQVITNPVLENNKLDFNGRRRWYDHDSLESYLKRGREKKFAFDAFKRATDIFAEWSYRYEDQPNMIASLICCTWVQSMWDWRPLVSVIGPSDCGKTMLLRELIKPMFGRLALVVDQPSEAGIRQALAHHSFALLIDEFESDAKRQKVMDILRIASRGGDVVRGTANQEGIKFRLKHIVWTAGIESGQKRLPDRNRYILIELKSLDPSKRGQIELPDNQYLTDLGLRLLAIAVGFQHDAAILSNELKKQRLPGVPGRIIESYSVPVALLAAVQGYSADQAIGLLGNTLTQQDFSEQRLSDETDLIETIFRSEASLPGGVKRTVVQLLSFDADPESAATLDRIGIKIAKKEPRKEKPMSEKVYFFCHSVISRMLLRGTHFDGHRIDQILLRLPNAFRDKQKISGMSCRGISVPVASVEEQFPEISESPDNGNELMPLVEPERHRIRICK